VRKERSDDTRKRDKVIRGSRREKKGGLLNEPGKGREQWGAKSKVKIGRGGNWDNIRSISGKRKVRP